MVALSVVQGDIRTRPCDLLILKHAGGLYGVDDYIAKTIGFEESVQSGRFSIVGGAKTRAKHIVFLGVGPLSEFDYAAIRQFGRRALEVAKTVDNKAAKICMPIHGPGYGLDENEAFSSLIAGLTDGIVAHICPTGLREIEIVEIRENRARRFSEILAELADQSDTEPKDYLSRDQYNVLGPKVAEALRTFGSESGKKIRLFVAMPFKDELTDEWEISIQDAAHSNGILCERVDKSAFVGDIISEVKRRIEDYDGLIAVLNDANPNVYLELGYAWAKEKPAVLVAKVDQTLPFDVKGQRCILYKGIADLRAKLTNELAGLKSAGIFKK